MAQHTRTVNPLDRTEANQSPAAAPLPPSLPRYLPTSPLSLLTLPVFTQMPYDSNVFKTKSNSFQPLCFAKNCANVHQQHTNVLIRHFICKFAVELNDSEFML